MSNSNLNGFSSSLRVRKEAETGAIPVFLLFFFWPLLSVIFTFFKYREKWGKNIIWLFSGFAGYIFIFYGVSDCIRYRDKFIAITGAEITFNNFYSYLSSDENIYIEVLQPLISLITAQFTDSYRVFYSILGFVFGYFYSRNIWYILKRVNSSIKGLSIIFFVVFAVLFCFWDINVVRFATATMIFQRGLMPYLIEKDRKSLFWCLVAPFMHLTYVIPLFLFILFLVIGNRRVLYFYIFIFGLLLGEVELSAIQDNEFFLPQAYQAKSDSYANDDYADYRKELDADKVWYYRIYKIELKWMAAAVLLFLYLKTNNNLFFRKKYGHIVGFSCFFYGIFCILSNIPVMDRYLFVGSLYIFAPAFLFLNEKGVIRENILWVYLAFPFLLYFVLIRLRTGIPFMSYHLLIGNPISSIFFFDDISILDVIKP